MLQQLSEFDPKYEEGHYNRSNRVEVMKKKLPELQRLLYNYRNMLPGEAATVDVSAPPSAGISTNTVSAITSSSISRTHMVTGCLSASLSLTL